MRRGPSDRETSVEFCPEQSAGRKAVGLLTRAEGLERKGVYARACVHAYVYWGRDGDDKTLISTPAMSATNQKMHKNSPRTRECSLELRPRWKKSPVLHQSEA